MLDIGGGGAVIFQATTATESGPLVVGTRKLHSLHANDVHQPKSSVRATSVSTEKEICSGTGIRASARWAEWGRGHRVSSAMVPGAGQGQSGSRIGSIMVSGQR